MEDAYTKAEGVFWFSPNLFTFVKSLTKKPSRELLRNSNETTFNFGVLWEEKLLQYQRLLLPESF